MDKINILAVFIAALSMFLIGGLWYSKLLFGNSWLSELNEDESFLSKGNKLVIFGLSFLISVIMSFNLAAFIIGFESWYMGTLAGFLAGFVWVALSLAIIYLFERRSLKLFLINGGYIVSSFLVMGTILGLWR
jgi:membrane-associated HD superfamily phosphohydrolase